MTPDEVAIVAQAVEQDEQLREIRDQFLSNYEAQGGKHLGPSGAALLIYELGRMLIIAEAGQAPRAWHRRPASALNPYDGL